MRLSSIKGDAGFQSFAELANYTVKFNGKERHDCKVADEERGYIIILFQRMGRTVSSTRMYGKVEITRKEALKNFL